MSLLNKTKLPYFLLGIGLFMIFGGGGSLFIAELKQDHEEVNKRQVNVKEIYNTFSHNVELFESERDNLYGGIFGEMYFDQLADGDEIIKESLDNYEQVNNCLVKDISAYNDNVKTFNMNNVNQINIYKLERKYIDYNKDKSFDGK